ncbi:MAG: flagellar basal-body MS-ring/collar protein FliF [bacterium]|nr:flagellar basal-body MS-ring/collar protein FliF [bacterium]
MPEFLQNILSQVQGLWGKLDNTKKITLAAVLGAIVIAFVAMASFSSQPARIALYEDMSQSDFASVTQALEAMGYGYSASGGSNIYVEPADRDQIITRLAQDNLIPAGVEGYEIFDMSRWDETTFDKNVKLHRAIKGSLEKMLMTLDFVKRATVNLAIPERNNFLSDDEPVKASVVIRLRPGVEKPSRRQVMGIKNLIFRSVPRLNRENISISDEQGKEFVEPDEIDDAQRELELVERKKDFEERERRRWREEIRGRLHDFYPEDRLSIIRVAFTVNWDEVQEKQTLVSPVEETAEDPNTPYPDRKIMPNGTLVVSENSRQERFKGNGFTPGGPTGTEQQLPPGYRDLDYQRSEYGNNDVIRNYAFNQTEKDIKRQPWDERARSIALAVDGVWTKEGEEELPSGDWRYIRKYTEPAPEELRKLERLLKASLLYNSARGDQIEVQSLQKDRRAEFAEEDAALSQRKFVQRLFVVSAVALAVFLLVFLLYRAIKKEIARRRRLREEELAAQQQLMREAALRVADEGAAEVELSVDEKARREMLENAMNLAREKPDQVAKLIRTWLSADEA